MIKNIDLGTVFESGITHWPAGAFGYEVTVAASSQLACYGKTVMASRTRALTYRAPIVHLP